jgi:hypothetical protein
VLPPGRGQRQRVAPAARLLAVAAEQPGRHQLLELPGKGRFVQAEVRGQVGRAHPWRDVDLRQQRVGDQRKAGVKLVADVAGSPGERGETQVQVVKSSFASHISPSFPPS